MKISMDKKRIAKEWLYFLGITILFPFALIPFHEKVSGFDELIIPYLLFLFVRSIIWAIKTIRRPG
jgi:hypothetical protein